MNPYLDKCDSYFSDSREEMLKYVPGKTKTILEIGCGNGFFGKLCKENLFCTVHGVEYVDSAAQIANANLDLVYTGDFRSVKNSISKGFYDLIVLNDVIEHVLDPEEFILSLKEYLSPSGKILFSVPNFRYIYNLLDVLINKNFEYKESGTLDKTHLTFFTRKSFKNTVTRLGFEILNIQGINEAKSIKMGIIKPFLKLLNHEDVLFYQFAFLIQPKSSD